MAPQETASYYGAVVMDRGEKSAPPTSPMAKRIAVAVLAAMAVVGVATMMASSSVPVREAFVVDVAAEAEAAVSDCKCAQPCQYLYSAAEYSAPAAVLGSAPTWVNLADPRIVVFIKKNVMVCPVAGDGNCRDVTFDRSNNDETRGKPQQYGGAADEFLAVCENFDTNCNIGGTGGKGCGSHGFCVAKAKAASNARTVLDGHEQHSCVCDPGYQESAGGCVNINECDQAGAHNCNLNADCTDLQPVGDREESLTAPKFECTCKDGWEGEGYDFLSGSTNTLNPGKEGQQGCIDKDMCLTANCNHVKRDGAGKQVCEDLDAKDDPTGYHCTCAEGWEQDHICNTDIDECKLNRCPLNSACLNVEGSFTCTCKENWVAENTETAGALSCKAQGFCDENPCLNGGTCVIGLFGCGFDENDFKAKVANMAYRDKEFDEKKLDWISAKTSQDCYTCTCVDGWQGDDCEIDTDECTDADTANGCDVNADCVNTAGSFECICHLGWRMGEPAKNEQENKCVDIDDCAESTPCAHGGTCVDCGTLCFTCTCVVGWRGTTCTKDWNECTMGIHDCNNDATCINTPGSYACKCDPGFAGQGYGSNSVAKNSYVAADGSTEDKLTADAASYLENLQKGDGCVDINDCGYNTHESPCKNMAECEDMGTGYYRCICKAGWTDSECDEDVDECNPGEWTENSCSPYAKCINKDRTENAEGYECKCNRGYSGNGQVCTDINDCRISETEELRCAENGFCKDLGVDYFKCECNAGFIGIECAEDENECVVGSDNCGSNTVCVNTDGSFTCECQDGYAGAQVAAGGECTDIDDCTAGGCKNGSTCRDTGVGQYECACAAGWTDANCDFDVNECLSETAPCHPSAICRNTPGTYTCKCRSGFDGDGKTVCVDTDDCATGDNGGCLNGATCDSGITSGIAISGNMRVCHCKEGYRGCGSPFCAIDCADCRSFANKDADCTEVPGGTCTQTCKKDFWGPKGECAITCNPCTLCRTGYEETQACTSDGDTQCDNINECINDDLNECTKVNAGCLDTLGSYECSCKPGYFGDGIGDGGCAICTACQAGFHENSPCTTTSDRTCAIDLPSGSYRIESEADGNKQCLGIFRNEWYPKRIDYGDSSGPCGLNPKEEIPDSLRWTFTALYNNEVDNDSQLYTISHVSMDDTYSGADQRCMYFGSMGKDIYPTLQSCVDYLGTAHCPWGTAQDTTNMCDFKIITDGGVSPSLEEKKKALVENGQAVFKVVSIKMSEKKYIIQAKSQEKITDKLGDYDYCVSFDNEGGATNPSRYNWGNGGDFCGVGDWEGYGKEMALLSNKQAIFILSSL